jgi:hypothetical protein
VYTNVPSDEYQWATGGRERQVALPPAVQGGNLMTSLNFRAEIDGSRTLSEMDQAFAAEIRNTTPCRIAVSLDWDYCPDGVKIHEYGLGQSGPLALNETGRWVQPKSEAKLTRRFELRGLSDLKVLKFVGTEDDYALIDFMSVYGIVGGSFETGVSEQSLDRIKEKRDGLQALLHRSFPVGVLNKIDLPIVRVVLHPRSEGRPTLALHPKSLYGFMCMEAALLVTGNSRIMNCENCGALFAVGRSSGKRARSNYCSQRCRSAVQRRRLHEKTKGLRKVMSRIFG